VSITGIITTYLMLRLLVRRGFHNIYPDQTVPAHLQKNLVSGYPTNIQVNACRGLQIWLASKSPE